MDGDITTLQAAWDALEMELLTPARLSDADFAAILAARAKLSGDVFAMQLPMTVAYFKQSAQDEIYARAVAKGPYKKDRLIARKFKADMSKINRIFFGTGIERATATMGIFKKPLAGYLHSDEDFQSNNISYLCRLFELRLLIIRDQAKWQDNEEITQLIFSARHEKGALAVAALQKLIEQNIVEKNPLGEVVMLRLGSSQYDLNGTLHASSPVSSKGVLSALMAAKGQNSPSFC